MKRRYASIILMLFLALILSACRSKGGPKEIADEVKASSEESEESVHTILIEVGGETFHAAANDNNTVRALAKRLPMTLSMDEMNGNEKFCYMNESLPAEDQKVGSIKAGDILLYGSDCLVIFFEDFNTSYSYTRIGHIEDAENFVKALSGGRVEVTFRAGE